MRSRWLLILWIAVGPLALAQREPHIGYVYPAGGRPGTTFIVTVGGQFLNGVTNAFVNGAGVQASVVALIKPPTMKEAGMLRDRLKELQEKRGEPGTAAEVAEIVKKLAPLAKKPASPAIAESVTLQITIAPNAPVGERELLLRTAGGLSNPLLFCVDELPEFTGLPATAIDDIKSPADLQKRRQQRATPSVPKTDITLPATVNGQIMPGEVDRYQFKARQGQRLVVAARARALIPYLADAVPGWFQATLALYDSTGKELAYDDDYRFHPDPVLFYEIPRAGDYVLEIRDAIYRGREDFVYRIAIGELPFVTSVFPLGRATGMQTNLEVHGWNLAATYYTVAGNGTNGGVFPLSIRNRDWISNRVAFDVGTLPECFEKEPNNSPSAPQTVELPVIVNGRIDRPGDSDVFRFAGHAGDSVVAEVLGRRLGSPLDSQLKLTDSAGKSLAFNDDFEDKGSGLNTHHADSYLRATLPANGWYFLHLTDTQNRGSPAHAYRLRLSAPQPDFALRVVPSSLTARAGATVSFSVFALRRDGFSEPIDLLLKNAPNGFGLSNACLSATQDQVRVSLRVPPLAVPEPVTLVLQGRAKISGGEVMHEAVPANDMMQAFIYRHLVPAQELKVAIIGGRKPQ